MVVGMGSGGGVGTCNSVGVNEKLYGIRLG